MERGTGIEPATNSVEGCDSTVELPPPSLVITDTKFTTAWPGLWDLFTPLAIQTKVGTFLAPRLGRTPVTMRQFTDAKNVRTRFGEKISERTDGPAGHDDDWLHGWGFIGSQLRLAVDNKTVRAYALA